ncbi:hypothetical protein Hdeb2414_s0007g00233821 [Helianthus debilis subsp. tardiflorus]
MFGEWFRDQVKAHGAAMIRDISGSQVGCIRRLKSTPKRYRIVAGLGCQGRPHMGQLCWVFQIWFVADNSVRIICP